MEAAAFLEDLFWGLLLPQFWKQAGQLQFFIQFQKTVCLPWFKEKTEISRVLLQ